MGDANTSGGFTMLDNGAIERSREVGPSAFLVYCAIARHGKRSWPGIDRLAAMTGLSPRSVRYAIEHLEKAGWLVVERQAGQKNIYVLPPIDSKATSCQPPETSKAMDCQGVGQPVAAGEATSCQGVRQPVAAEEDLRKKTQEKDSRKKTKRGCAAEVVFPSELSSDSFKEAWERWTAHRKEIKKSLTPSTIAAQLKKLAAWGESRAIAAIDHSIEAGWTGIFEETKTGANKNGKRSFPLGPGQRHASSTAKPGVF